MRLVVVCFALAAALSVGCEADCNSIEPAYAGAASDETWRSMIDARAAATEGGDASTITVPAPGAQLQKSDDAVVLTWESPLQSALLLPSSSSSWSPLPRPARQRPNLLDALSQTLFPRAHAHLPPITSDLHLIEIDVPGRTCPVAGITTEQSFTFAQADWQQITEAAGERTLRLMSAFVTENRVTEGPFLAAPINFAVIE